MKPQDGAGSLLLFVAPLLLPLGFASELTAVTCGSVIKLLNTKHNVRLHSHDVRYGSGPGANCKGVGTTRVSITGLWLEDQTDLGIRPFSQGQLGSFSRVNMVCDKCAKKLDPYGKARFAICRICKSSVHQAGSHFWQGCAYKKGICAMCGNKVLDTKNYKQTSV